MPNIRSAIKRMRQNTKRRTENRSKHSTMRTSIKKLRAAIEENNPQTASALLPETISIIDKAAAKGLIHKNAAARHTSRLTRQVHALQSQPAAEAS